MTICDSVGSKLAKPNQQKTRCVVVWENPCIYQVVATSNTGSIVGTPRLQVKWQANFAYSGFYALDAYTN